MNIVSQWTQQWTLANKAPFYFFQTTGSTNKDAKKLKTLTQTPSLLIAENQTQGRGRNSKKWMNSDFMSSWTWKQPEPPPADFSVKTGKCLFQIFKEIWPQAPWRFKEPNDIYLDKHKTAGLLIESLPIGREFQIIAGAGVNVFKAPPIAGAGFIASYVNIQKSHWMNFLSQFSNNIQNHIKNCKKK